MNKPIVWKSLVLVFFILLVDQALKIWVKTNMSLGEDLALFGMWARIHFVENPGMAFGMNLGGKAGKLFLSLFRLVAIGAIIWYVRSLVRHRAPQGFILCVCLILAGAIGNMIDCAFYGLIFDQGMVFSPELDRYTGYSGVAALTCDGYAPFLQGCVVDMLSFPIINGTFPSWFPFVGGEPFLFFAPIFNVADSAVTVGVLALLFFHRGYMKKTVKDS